MEIWKFQEYGNPEILKSCIFVGKHVSMYVCMYVDSQTCKKICMCFVDRHTWVFVFLNVSMYAHVNCLLCNTRMVCIYCNVIHKIVYWMMILTVHAYIYTYILACKHIWFQYFGFPNFWYSGFLKVLKLHKYGNTKITEIWKSKNP